MEATYISAKHKHKKK